MVAKITDRGNAAGTKKYFSAQERIEGREAYVPIWYGKGAARLGLAGKASRAIFNRLVDNKTPDGKGKLTPRNRKDSIRLWDVTVSMPKGVTLAAMFAPDGHLVVEACRRALLRVMDERLEPLAVTRDRKGGRMGDTVTAEITGTLFTHLVSRAGDPHLHFHATVHNHTFNPMENRFKALKVFEIWKKAVDIEAHFHLAIREELRKLGFHIEIHGQKSYEWDIAGISQATKDKFSERRKQCVSYMDKVREEGRRVSGKLRGMVATLTRQEKPQNVELDQLKREWLGELTRAEKKAFMELKENPKTLAIRRMVARNKARSLSLRMMPPDRGREISYER